MATETAEKETRILEGVESTLKELSTIDLRSVPRGAVKEALVSAKSSLSGAQKALKATIKAQSKAKASAKS